ncbi:hypothetical protein F5Y04DRAFT_269091 [Hypomontagnella monticulosa]|nr:hypothetical protein F5Y04DRAFT_269091 [Hypomontagnella monticulosa]
MNMTTDFSNQPVGWQPGNSHRSTWAIVSNCLSTIIACTWSVQHLNVPGSQDGFWTRLLRNCKWMLITILFPEFVVLHAMLEFTLAIQAFKLIEENFDNVDYPWWYNAKPFPNDTESNEPHRTNIPSGTERPIKWTLTHCFFANMGGIIYRLEKRYFPLTAHQIARTALKYPDITEEYIEDKSKRDWFSKIVAALQFSQLVLSLILRTARGLEFSQLETVTLGLAVCGVAIYLLYIYKPQNIATAHELRRVRQGEKWVELESESETSIEHHLHPQGFRRTYDSFWKVLINQPMDPGIANQDDRVPNDNIPISQNRVAHPAIFILAAFSGLFGALHAIAWNFEFPTKAERILWQTATIVATVSPVMGLITIPFLQRTRSWGNPQLFLRDCLRLLREYSWHSTIDTRDPSTMGGPNTRHIIESIYKSLEDIYVSSDTTKEEARKLYKDEFELLFTQEAPELGFSDEFRQRFHFLVDIIDGKLSISRRLGDEARTHIFPRRILLPEPISLVVFGVTSLLYCVSRLSLLAVSLSTLRRMPESVYVNTIWTAYIPALGSSN